MASTKRPSSDPDLTPRSVRPKPQPEPAGPTPVQIRLQELERLLLLDRDDDTDLSLSGITTGDLNETIESLLSPSPLTLPSPSSQTSSPTTTQLLVEAATAISDGNPQIAAPILSNLRDSRREADGNFADYIVGALQARIDPISRDEPELCSIQYTDDMRLLYEASPCFELGLLLARFTILDAVRDCPRLHFVDFDFGNGSRYIPLLASLAGRRADVKITAVVDPGSRYNSNAVDVGGLSEAGDRVVQVAAGRMGLRVGFRVKVARGSELTREALSCGEDEAVVVNFAFVLSRVADESVGPENPRDGVLRAVRGMRPRVVVLVEEELNCNTVTLAVRVAEACGHYGAVVESAVGDRARVEGCVGRRAGNAVAEEGRRRVERCELFGKWRARMRMAGYEVMGIGRGAMEAVRKLAGPEWTVEEEEGGAKVVWKGRVMTVASAWR